MKELHTFKDVPDDAPIAQTYGAKLAHGLGERLEAATDDEHDFPDSKEATRWLQDQVNDIIEPQSLIGHVIIIDPAKAHIPEDWNITDGLLLVFRDLTWTLIGNRKDNEPGVTFAMVVVAGAMYFEEGMDLDNLPMLARISSLKFLDVLEGGVAASCIPDLAQMRLYLTPPFNHD